MKKNGINMKRVKIANRMAILRTIMTVGKTSQKDISNSLKLTQGAVSLICNEMIEEGILVQTGETAGGCQVGRKQVLVDINYDYKYVIGIDISYGSAEITITNMKADIIKSHTCTFEINMEPSSMLRGISSNIIKLLWENNIPKTSIVGVGVTVLGVVDEVEGISINDYKMWKCRVNIREILERELGLKIFVENNVCAFAIGETLFYGKESYEDSLFLKWGRGVGSAIIIKGSVYKTNNSSSAEIGHTIIDVNGDVCSCGARGCIETKVSLGAISKKLKGILENIGEIKNEVISEKNVVKLLLYNYDEVKRYRNEIVRMLSMAVYNSTRIILPKKIILYGYMFESDELLKSFIEEFRRISENAKSIEFTRSVYISKERYIGAIGIAVQRGFVEVGGL